LKLSNFKNKKRHYVIKYDSMVKGGTVGGFMFVTAELAGSAGFNFLVKSDGIDASARSGSCSAESCNSLDKLVPMTTMSPITFAVSGVPVTITPSVGLSGGLQ
jgi:hypothetical protein